MQSTHLKWSPIKRCRSTEETSAGVHREKTIRRAKEGRRKRKGSKGKLRRCGTLRERAAIFGVVLRTRGFVWTTHWVAAGGGLLGGGGVMVGGVA